MQKKIKRAILSLLYFLIFCLFPLSLQADLIKEYTIGPQDVLNIEVWDNPDLSREATVSLRGTISFPLVGEIDVEGLTGEQLQSIIRTRLADGYLVNPQVTVTVKEYNSKKIYVLGEVNKPSDYPFTKATTMVELISMAGGLTQDAGQEAYILRSTDRRSKPSPNPENKSEIKGGSDSPKALSIEKWANDLTTALEASSLSKDMLNTQVITINLNDFNQGINLNFELQNNDTLYIPKAKFFYVIGEVKSPGRFKMEKEVNVLQAISMSGGLTQKANTKKAKVIRHIHGKDQEVNVGMTDLVLPNDIIKIEESFF